MIQKLKKNVVGLAAMAAMLMPGLVPALAMSSASAVSIPDSICQGTNNASSGTNTPGSGGKCGTAGSQGTDLSGLASKIVNIFSILVGIVAVLMIIYGGFRYITSGGDSGSVGNAKNTLIYAIVGLIIVALAQFIVHYVLNTATDTGLTNS